MTGRQEEGLSGSSKNDVAGNLAAEEQEWKAADGTTYLVRLNGPLPDETSQGK